MRSVRQLMMLCAGYMLIVATALPDFMLATDVSAVFSTTGKSTSKPARPDFSTSASVYWHDCTSDTPEPSELSTM